jgi:hypothetical protein
LLAGQPLTEIVTFRVELGAGAQAQFHSLPEAAQDALVARAVQLADRPWDAAVRPPGRDSRFRETMFGAGRGILGFYLDQEAQLIRIFDIVWVG